MNYPLQRCEGDCDRDTDCDEELFCMSIDSIEVIPGCEGSRNAGSDFCADINDFDYAFTLLPSGGWSDDWSYSESLEIDLTGE